MTEIVQLLKKKTNLNLEMRAKMMKIGQHYIDILLKFIRITCMFTVEEHDIILKGLRVTSGSFISVRLSEETS